MTATTTIYARVPTEVKEATDSYAAEHGMTLAKAVADLLGRGIEAACSENSVSALEVRASELQRELDQVRPALDAMHERLPQKLGVCKCGQPLTGEDLLIKGTCPKCSHSLASVLAGTNEDAVTVQRTDLAPFLAAVGLALAVVLIASRGK